MSNKPRNTETRSDKHSGKEPVSVGKILTYVVLFIGSIIMIFPFYWMISSSLKTRQEVSLFPPQFAPAKWFNFENYRLAANTAPFARYFINSVVVCFCSVAVVTCSTIQAQVSRQGNHLYRSAQHDDAAV